MKKKIVEITKSYFPSVGGLEKFVSDRIKIYKDLGYDYEIISTFYSTEKTNNDCFKEDCVKYQQFTKYGVVPFLKKKLPSTCDLVMVNQIGNYLSDYAISYYSKLNIPIVITPHMYFHTKNYNILKKIHKRLLSKKLFSKANSIICFTEYEKQFWIGHGFKDINKFKIIPHYFTMETSSAEISLNINEPYILYLGRTSENKKIEILLDSINELNDYKYSIYLTVEKHKYDLERRFHNNKIKYLGYISDSEKEYYLENCSALILPTDYEAFGIVLLEASAYKKPLLLSRLPVFDEILANDGTIYFDNSKESIKNSLMKFSQLNEKEKKNMGEINYRNLERFSYDKIKEVYSSLINTLLNR